MMPDFGRAIPRCRGRDSRGLPIACCPAGSFLACTRTRTAWIKACAKRAPRPSRPGGTMLDLIIRGGDVVTPQGTVRCDVAIAGETIAAVAAPGTLPQSAAREIDAAGRIVMPGGIDPHVHMQHTWMLPGGVSLTTAGPTQVGRAALYG